MNRLDERFASLGRERRKALIAYMTAGYPSMKGADRAFRDLARGGADVIEIGVPFSDPIADGPTIQASSFRALQGGVNLKKILAWVARLRKSFDLPIVLMGYMNPIHRMGYAAFARAARAAGVDGVIVPDLIPEEGKTFEAVLAAQGVHVVYLVAPTTPRSRWKMLASRSRGFLYAVSVLGVTGVRKGFPPGALSFVRDLRRQSPLPVAVGFGISGPDQARAAAKVADGVIVGSAFVARLRDKKPLLPFVKQLRAALDRQRAM
jgi:tryptophan synthase alpha chain